MPINVVSPDGKSYSVPDEELSAYKAAGFTPEDDETRINRLGEEFKDDLYGGTGGALKAAGLGALSGLTVGLSDVALSGLGARDTLREYRDRHRIASVGGNILGGAIPSLLSGGAATPAGLVSKLGSTVKSGLAGEGAGLLARTGAATVAAGVEGSIYGGGQYIGESAIEDKPLTAAGFVGGMGQGALFGAPLGAAFHLGAEGLTKVRSLFPKAEISEAAAAVAKSDAKGALQSSIADADQMLAAADDQIAVGTAQAGTEATKEHITRTVFGAADPASLEAQAAHSASAEQLRLARARLAVANQELKEWIARGGGNEDLDVLLSDLPPPSVAPTTDRFPTDEFGAPGSRGIKTPEELARAVMESGGVGESALSGLSSKSAVSPSSLDATGAARPKSSLVEPEAAPAIETSAPLPTPKSVVEPAPALPAERPPAAGEPPPSRAAPPPHLSDKEFSSLADSAASSLSDEEREAALGYSRNGLYAVINGGLRRQHENVGKASLRALSPDIRESAQLLDSMLARNPAPRAMTVFRGVHGQSSLKHANSLKPGDAFVDPAFISTSYDNDVGLDYARWMGGGSSGGVKYDIAVPEGYPVFAIPSEFPKEREILLGRGGKYIVDDVLEATSSSPKIIKLRVEPPEVEGPALKLPEGVVIEVGPRQKQFTAEPAVVEGVPEAMHVSGSDGMSPNEHVFVARPSAFLGKNLRIEPTEAPPAWSDAPAKPIIVRAIRGEPRDAGGFATYGYTIDEGAEKLLSAIADDRPVAMQVIIAVKKPPKNYVAADDLIQKFAPAEAVASASAGQAAATEAVANSTAFTPSGRSAGGTQGGKWYVDKDGASWFGKNYRGDVDRVESEHLANRIYREFGVGAPETKIAVLDNKRTMMSRELPGKEATPESLAMSDARDGFVIDAWLANWDVVGTGFDNMLVHKMEASRIDNGGALIFRAQGEPKPFSAPVRELETMRDPSRPSGKVFGKISDEELDRQLSSFSRKYEQLKPDVDKMIDEAKLSPAAKEKIRSGLHERAEWLKAQVRKESDDIVDDLASEVVGAPKFEADSSPSPARTAAASGDDDLLALLQGTNERLGKGESFRSISKPAEDAYVANKAVKTADAAEHFRGLAKAKADGGAPEDALLAKPPAPAVEPALALPGEDAQRTVRDKRLRGEMQSVADEAAIEKLLRKEHGRGVDIGPSVERAAKVIGEHEAASADVAELLGAQAPRAAVERASKLKQSRAAQAENQGQRTAMTASKLDRTAVDPEVQARLREATVVETGMGERMAGVRNPDATAIDPDIRAQMDGIRTEDKIAEEAARANRRDARLQPRQSDASMLLDVLRATNSHIGILDAIPVIGPVLSAVLKARAVYSVLKRGAGSIGKSVEGLVASKSAQTQDRIVTATKGILDGKLGKPTRGKATASVGGAAAVLGHSLFPSSTEATKGKKKPGLNGLYEQRISEVTRALQPNAIDDAIADRYPTANAELQQSIVDQTRRGYQFILDKAPKAPAYAKPIMGGGIPWTPSATELHEWARTVKAVTDPASVLEELAHGKLSMEGAEALRVVYPPLFQLAQRTLIKAAPEMQGTVPYARRVAISIMYRVPVDTSMTPQHLRYLMPPPQDPTGGGGSPPAAAPPPGGGGAPALSGPLQTGQNTMTALDRRAGS